MKVTIEGPKGEMDEFALAKIGRQIELGYVSGNVGSLSYAVEKDGLLKKK